MAQFGVPRKICQREHMSAEYKLIIRGAQAGHSAEQVASALAPLLRRPVDQLLPALSARLPITITLKGLALPAARAFLSTIQETGCASTLDSTAPRPPPAPSLPGDFNHLQLRPFTNRTVGLVLHAPEDWRDVSEGELFRIQHAGTDTWITASLNRSPGVELAVWAELRFGAIADKMAYFQPHGTPYSLETAAGAAIVAEFRGTVPGDADPTHQLVLCLRPEIGALSLNITAAVDEFERHRSLYQWLLRTQLRLLDVGSLGAPAAGMGDENPEEQFDNGVRFMKAGRPEEGAGCFRKAAEQGHAQAQFALGFCYQRGEGVARSDRHTFEWWRKAAEQGLAPAQVNLASMYERGVGTAADAVQAFHWRHEAAEQGDPEAQYGVAVCYVQGNGVAEDVEMAAQWALKAAAQGHRAAQFYVGAMHEGGEGLPRDVARAIEWYRKAAAQGHATATERLQALGALN
jgi:hypothetical protein